MTKVSAIKQYITQRCDYHQYDDELTLYADEIFDILIDKKHYEGSNLTLVQYVGLAYDLDGDIDNATKYYEQGYQPNNPNSVQKLIDFYKTTDNEIQLIMCLSMLNDTDPRSYCEHVDMCLKVNDFERAMYICTLMIVTDHQKAYACAFNVYSAQHKYKELIEVLLPFVSTSSTARMYNIRAKMMLNMMSVDDVIVNLLACIDDGNIDAMFELADLYEYASDVKNARDYYRMFIHAAYADDHKYAMCVEAVKCFVKLCTNDTVLLHQFLSEMSQYTELYIVMFMQIKTFPKEYKTVNEFSSDIEAYLNAHCATYRFFSGKKLKYMSIELLYDQVLRYAFGEIN